MKLRMRWIDNYAGTWEDDEGRTLIITPRVETIADVDLLVNGTPMLRPWCGDKPARSLRGTLIPAHGPGLDIDLGRPGFSLDVNYEPGDYMPADGVEWLSVGISRYESDIEAEAFVRMFGKLGSFRRRKPEQPGPGD